MKKRLITIVVLLLAVVIGGYCYLRVKKDVCKNVIPADAKAVLAIDTKQFLKAIDFSLSDIVKLLKSDDKKKDPGIDFLRPIYGFVSNEGYLCCVLPLSDAKDLEKLSEEYGISVESQRGLKWVYISQILCCFDEDKALLLGPVSQAESNLMRPAMTKWMTQGEQENRYFAEVQKQEGIVKVSSSVGTLPKDYLIRYSQLFGNEIDWNDVLLNAAFNISDYALSLSFNMTSNDPSFNKLTDQYSEHLRPIKADLLETASENPFLWIGMNVNGGKVLEGLRKNPLLRTILVAANLKMDVDMLLNSIDGDVSFELCDIYDDGPGNMMLKAEVNNQDFLKNVPSWDAKLLGFSSQFQSVGPNDFMLSEGEAKFKFGVNDNQFYLSYYETDEAPVAKFSEKTLSPYKSKMEGKRFFATVDIGRMAQIREFQPEEDDDRDKLNTLVSTFGRLNISMSDDNTVELELTTKQKTSDLIKGLLE